MLKPQIDEQLSETEETRRGALLARVLKLRRDPEYKDRWQTRWGNKTDLGIYRVVVRMITEGKDS